MVILILMVVLICISLIIRERQVRWSSLEEFSTSLLWVTQAKKSFGVVNKTEIDVFREFSCFSFDPMDVGNLISGFKIKTAEESGLESSQLFFLNKLSGSYSPLSSGIPIILTFVWLNLIVCTGFLYFLKSQISVFFWLNYLYIPILQSGEGNGNPLQYAWKVPWTEEPGGLQSMGSLRVGHNWATSLSLFTFMHWRRKWQPTPMFLPGESQGRGSLVGCRLWAHTESDTTEVT